MNGLLERRTQRMEQARDELERFLASPGADHVVEFLNTALNVFPLHQQTAEKTYFKLGLFEAVQFFEETQKRARGTN